ncbi:MAG: sulfatase-like hydrolase/transferase [Pseudomonadota bacterium]
MTPNILVFFTDQQRWDTCGCYGQSLNVTPRLDELAGNGVLFENAYTCQPVCGPARAAIQTGVYPTDVGCHTNHRLLPLDADTIAKRLGDSGYQCHYIGKWHLASTGPREGTDDFRVKAVPPERRGGFNGHWLAADALEFTSHGYGGHMFDAEGRKREFDETTYRVDAQTDWLIEHLSTWQSGQPNFTFVSYLEPHHQNDRNRYEGPLGSKERWADYLVPGDLTDTEGDWRENFADYLGCCNALDDALGRAIDHLSTSGLLDETLIIFTSDHGSHFRTRNPEYKRSCHDACLHIPLVVSGPGFTGGQRIDHLATNLDLPGTILRAAGLEVPDHFRGHALQDVVSGQSDRKAIYVQISESQCGRAIRTPDFTYSVRAEGGAKRGQEAAADRYHERHLYDNHADPHQRQNLIADPAFQTVRSAMKQLLLEEMAHAENITSEILPPEESSPAVSGTSR